MSFSLSSTLPQPQPLPEISPPPAPRQVAIKTFPFLPPVASQLTTALDNELNEMYPDWNDLPHPGFQQGFVGGDSLAASDKKEESRNEQQHLQQSTSEIYFFVAFDITDSDNDHDPATSTSTSGLTPPAIACIALKPLPYFPYHRAQGPSNLTSTPTLGPPMRAHPPLSSPSPSPCQSQAPQKYAELKRLYIAPSHRGVPISTSNSTSTSTSTSFPSSTTTTRLSTLLIHTATQHAQSLGITRLVLETGIRQHAAIRVYERLGWTRRAEYGDYVGAGVGDGGVSVCFEIGVEIGEEEERE